MINLSEISSVHIIGIGGAGMSAIATVLADTGLVVTGSDLSGGASVDRLTDAGVTVAIGHAADNLGPVDLVIRSTAIPDDNPEVLAARGRNIAVVSRAEALTALTTRWKTISVAGTHGKTTTSAMLSALLVSAGVDPSFIVGGDLLDLGAGARVGQSEWLVVEADESDGTFIELETAIAVVTNVEPDHLEHYGSFEVLKDAFYQFGQQASVARIVCIDDPGGAALAQRLGASSLEVTTYGVDPAADFVISEVLPSPAGISFRVTSTAGSVLLSLSQPGLYNARNATAAMAVASAIGVDLDTAASGLARFGGVGRRFEPRGGCAGIRFFDDYAHLPTEVASALDAAAELRPERLVAVFQPHRYSRTQQLWNAFGSAFGKADVLYVTGIYAANEAPRPGINGSLIVDAVTEHDPTAEIHYVEDLDQLVTRLADELRAGDLCLTLGAGDLTETPALIIERIENRE